MRLRVKYTIFIFMVLNILFSVLVEGPALGSEELPAGDGMTGMDSTLLMFVGEDLEVLSIASRREESAMQAPAVAQVITRDELKDKGIVTLSEALSTIPGFYMARKEWGTQPYLRGISNSILFLYDTVPMNSDTTKSLHQLDYELSLSPVKRIEIIRGPGSVLWGPDAFAGIVNVVPLTGADINGVETEFLYGSPGDAKAFSLNAGTAAGTMDAILTISGRYGQEDDGRINLLKYWGNDDNLYPPEERKGTGFPDASRYLDAYGRIEIHDLFSLSARITDNRKPYAITRAEGDLTWEESRSFPGGFVKLETKKDIGMSSALRVVGYYSQYNPEFEIIDRTLSQKEETTYGELIYDRSMFSKSGLFTGGLSYREKKVANANIFESYLPDYLSPDNEDSFPIILQKDYETKLWSAFGQYSFKWGKFDLSLGMRYDKHDSYEDNLSYNTTAVWNLSPRWILKLLYGTAYRTPFARQLLSGDSPELEKIQGLSSQIAWTLPDRAEASITGYANRLENHIFEDPYAGISEPNHQDVNGVEIRGRYWFTPEFDMSANLSLHDHAGPDERYEYVSSFFVDEEGNFIEEREQIEYPFDSGAKTTFNLMTEWRPSRNVILSGRLLYVSDRDLIYPRSEKIIRFSGQWTTDLSLRMENITRYRLGLACTVKNLFDQDYVSPGVYSGIKGDPLEIQIAISKKW